MFRVVVYVQYNCYINGEGLYLQNQSNFSFCVIPDWPKLIYLIATKQSPPVN